MKKLIFFILIGFIFFADNVYAFCDVNITWSSNTTYTMDQNNTYYCLNQSWYFEGVTTINSTNNLQNSTLDCLNYNLDGNDAPSTHGVYLTGSDIKNNTIKNCNMTNFFNGIRLIDSKNTTIINNIFSDNNNGNGIYLLSSHNNTIANNTISNILNGNGIYLGTSDNNILTNNTFNDNFYGIYLSNSHNNTIANNTVNNNDFVGIYLSSSNNNNITGGSIAATFTYDYWLSNIDLETYFRNTNFTNSRKVWFSSKPYWFIYNNETTGNIWLKTSVSDASRMVTRELVNWNNTLMQWNDTVLIALTVSYNISGLIPNVYYLVYNNSLLLYTLLTDSSGDLNFTLYLSSEHEIKVDVQEDYQSPQYSNIIASPESIATYSTDQTYQFSSTWTDNTLVSDVILQFDGVNYSYLNNEITKSGNTYSKTFTGLSIGIYGYKWFSNDTWNNWNSTSLYEYQIEQQELSPTQPPTEQPVEISPPEMPTEFPETVIELPDITPGTPITMPETGLTVKLEPNFVLTLYPLTNLTAVVHNISKIEKPSKYKILLCNQTLISSYEIEVTVDLAYFCANYSGYPIEDPTVNIFKFVESDWVPLMTEDVAKNAIKKIICGKVFATPYMVTGFAPTVDSQTALLAIQNCNSSIAVVIEQGIDVSKAKELLDKALIEYYSCNYAKAKELAEKALESLVVPPTWLIPVSFAAIAIVAVAWFWYYTVRIKVRVKK